MMVTHTGISGVHEHWRNIDDEQILAVADRGGCIGVIFSRPFLGGSDIDVVCDHLLHIINVAGEDVPSLGSDFDGVGDSLPEGLKDASMYPNLIAELLARGHDEGEIEKICSANVLRVWQAVEDHGASHRAE